MMTRGSVRALVMTALFVAFLAAHGSSVRGQPVVSIAMPDPGGTKQLYGGCNNIALSFANGTTCETVVQAVTPTGVVESMWRHNAALARFEGFSPAAPGASDLRTVNFMDAIWVCVSGAPAPSPPPPPPPTPTATPVPSPPPPPQPSGAITAKEAYPLALQAARTIHADAYLDSIEGGCSSGPYIGNPCFEWQYYDMASGDGRSEDWHLAFYASATQEGVGVHIANNQPGEGYIFTYGGPPPALPVEEIIDSTDAVRIADAHGGSAYKAANPGGQVCGAQMSAWDTRWQIDYCPPFEQGGKGLVVYIDGRTGEVRKTEESSWG
jgi:hypothetical protein